MFRAEHLTLEELFSEDWTSDCAKELVETCQLYYDPHSRFTSIDSQIREAETIDITDFDSALEASVPQDFSQPESPPLSKEISDYLSERVIGKASPLDWWRKNGGRFPRLAAMARDFLYIPGTSSQL